MAGPRDPLRRSLAPSYTRDRESSNGGVARAFSAHETTDELPPARPLAIDPA